MDHKQKLELASELIDNLFTKIFSDESRIIAMLEAGREPIDALIVEMGTSIRYIALSVLKDRLGLRSLDSGVPSLIDEIESRSTKRMRELVSKYTDRSTTPISDMLRPGRTI